MRDDIGEKIHLAVHMPRRAARGLDQRSLRAQVAFLVRIEDADQRDLRQIEPFAQQIDADQHVELRRPQRAQNLHALDGVDVAVQVAHLQPDIAQVVGKILRRAFGQRGDEHALVLFDALPAKLQRVVDLRLERPDGDLRIEQARRANDLLDDQRRARRVHIELLRPAHPCAKALAPSAAAHPPPRTAPPLPSPIRSRLCGM